MSALKAVWVVIVIAPLVGAVALMTWALFDEFGWRGIVGLVAVCVWLGAFCALAVLER